MLADYSFTVVGNGKRKIDECLKNIENYLKDKIEYQVITKFPFGAKERKIISKSNLVVVLGGDGTTLDVTRCIKNFQKTRIIPVNFGTLGYMTSVDEADLIEIIDQYLEYLKDHAKLNPVLKKSKVNFEVSVSEEDQEKYGFRIDERCLLEVKYKNKKFHCLNEVFLTNNDPTKSIWISIEINGESLADFKGDGIILSTPTGSTAYNMSCGGPILTPNVDAVILNPLSPHTLNIKPIVLSKKERVKFYTPDAGILVNDGVYMLKVKEPVVCHLSNERLSFIKSIKENHIKVLKNKLNFGKVIV